MLTKTTLIVAILASACTIALLHVKVDTQLTSLNTALATANANVNTLTGEKTKLAGDASQAETKAREIEAKRALASKERDELAAKLSKAESGANIAQKEIGELKVRAEGDVKVHQALSTQLAEATSALEKAHDENKKLVAQLNPVTPIKKSHFRGTITSVDPRWGFVVVNIGAKNGAQPEDELMVNRDGRLIAKLRITKVEKDHCIANVIEKNKLSQVLEGDEALN